MHFSGCHAYTFCEHADPVRRGQIFWVSLSCFGIDLSCVDYTAIMSSEKFEDLEDELKTLLEDTSNKVRNKIPRLSGGKLKELAFI